MTLLTEHDFVVWNYERISPPPQEVACLDLRDGRVSNVKLPRIARLERNSRGQILRMYHSGVELFDGASGQLLWHDSTLQGYQCLVGDRYLVRQQNGSLVVLDMFQVFEHPQPSTRLEEKPIEHNVPGLAERFLLFGRGSPNPNWKATPDIQPIAGTNRILCVSRDVPLLVSIYEIEPKQIRLIDAWPHGGGPVVQNAGQVWSTVPKQKTVEVRSLEDTRIVKRLSLPSEMNAWEFIIHRYDLFSFHSSKTGRAIVCRLEDFRPIAQLDLPLLNAATDQPEGQRHFHLLADATKTNSMRLVVYDSKADRILYDAAPPIGLQEVDINDAQLVTVTAALGLTVECIDLQSGKRSKLYQPFARRLLWLTMIAELALMVVIVWSYRSTSLPYPAWLKVALIAGLVSAPFIIRAVTVNYCGSPDRPCLSVLRALVFSITFLIAFNAAFGHQRLLLRLSSSFLWLSGLIGGARLFLGLEQQPYYHPYLLDGLLRTLVVFSLLATLALFGLRWIGLKRTLAIVDRPSSSNNIAMWDIFVFMASIAVFLVSAQPYRSINWIKEAPAAGIGAWILLSSLLGLVGLIRNRQIFRLTAMLQVALAAVVIAGTAARIALGNYAADPLWHYYGNLLALLYVMLATFVFCCFIRHADLPPSCA